MSGAAGHITRLFTERCRWFFGQGRPRIARLGRPDRLHPPTSCRIRCLVLFAVLTCPLSPISLFVVVRPFRSSSSSTPIPVHDVTPVRAPDGTNVVLELPSPPPRQSRRRDDCSSAGDRPRPFIPSFSPSSPCRVQSSRTGSSSRSPPPPPLPAAAALHLPDEVVEVVLDFLPVLRAVAMIVRSHAADRSLSCSKYALSRLDRMVTSLVKAEETFQRVRSCTDSSDALCWSLPVSRVRS